MRGAEAKLEPRSAATHDRNFMLSLFTSGDVFFLTFRGNSPKKNTISYISDRVRKISNTFFLVKEVGKLGDHFHGLLKLSSLPKKSWYVKGCHTHLRKLGKFDDSTTYPTPKLPLVGPDEAIEKFGHKMTDTELQMYLIETLNIKNQKLNKRCKYIHGCLNYMFKQMVVPIQYHNYILIVRKKSTVLPN